MKKNSKMEKKEMKYKLHMIVKYLKHIYNIFEIIMPVVKFEEENDMNELFDLIDGPNEDQMSADPSAAVRPSSSHSLKTRKRHNLTKNFREPLCSDF